MSIMIIIGLICAVPFICYLVLGMVLIYKTYSDGIVEKVFCVSLGISIAEVIIIFIIVTVQQLIRMVKY